MRKRIYIGLAVTLLLLPLLVWALRTPLLNRIFNSRVAEMRQVYHLQVTAKAIGFSGIDRVYVQGLLVKPLDADTLAYINRLELDVSVIHLLTGQLVLDKVNLSDANFTVKQLDGNNNTAFLKKKSAEGGKAAGATSVSYLTTAKALHKSIQRLLQTNIYAAQVAFSYTDSLMQQQLLVDTIGYNGRQFYARVVNAITLDSFAVNATVAPKVRHCAYTVENTDYKGRLPMRVPGSKEFTGNFRQLKGEMTISDEGGAMQLKLSSRVDGFMLRYWRLATDDILIENAGFAGLIRVTDDVIEVDSSSVISLNKIEAHTRVQYKRQPKPVFSLAVNMPPTVADTFFTSLPQGMFNTLKGISCTGSLAYRLKFVLPVAMPDSLQFSSALERQGFGIRKYGEVHYPYINEPFVFEAYDKDRFVRNIEVGPANPHYAPLQNISPYLVKAVLQSEDPSFMLHRGFLEEAFRESIIKNYKEKRFARGGSTISMQLVKNVFLSRNKTVSRKAEEALIVYLIENLRLVSKERMLEIYLNVIEWGPNVYGIGEAARFYFNKPPSALTLQESIFLAGIIPAPKWFKYQFNKEGEMKDYMNGYFRILSGRMAVKGWVSPADTVGLSANVKLTGPALQFVLPKE